MRSPKASIVIAAYKKESYLASTLDSVINQKYENIEIILINDGSPDKCPAICEHYAQKDLRIKYLSQENSGVIAARNRGISCASGDYIVAFDADDIMPPDFIGNLVAFALSNPDVDVVVPRSIAFGDKAGEITFPSLDLPHILLRNGIPNSSMFRKSAINTVGGYNKNMKHGLEDWDFWLYFVENDMKLCRTNSTFYYYRISKGSRNDMPIKERLMLKKQIYLNHKAMYDKWRPNSFIIKTYPLIKLLTPFGVRKETVRLAKLFKSIEASS